MAYWQNGKLYMHCSTQSTMRTIGAVARWVGIKPEEVVIISEYTGGGFGSKGSGTVFVVVPALLSKKTGAPVMMRITREQEQYIGRARPALHSRVKIGFRKDGRITALDGLAIVENGPYDVVGDARSAGDHISLSYQPMAMRWRSVSVLTNTPPRGAQRAPGGMQGNSLMAPIMAKAAHKLGIDQVAIHRINAPEGKAPFGGPNARGVQSRTTSAFLKDAIDKGAELFNWEARKARSGQRNGSKVRGLGMAVSAYSAGSVGFDGLFVIKPDGTMQIQSGIGNLGTESVFDVHRVAAETRRHAVGEGRGRLGQHREVPAVDLQPGRQPDDACDDAGGACRRHGREEEAAGDRREDAGRRSRVVSGGRRPRVQRRPQHDARPGGEEGHRAGWRV